MSGDQRSAKSRLFSAGFASRANLAADLLLLAAAVCLSRGTFLSEARTLAWVAGALASAWVVTAAALRHYAWTAYERSPLDDLAMIATQTGAVITVLAVLYLFAPAGTPLPHIPPLLAILFTGAFLFRLVFRRIAGREEPVAEVLIVGAGPIARLTAMDLLRRGRHRIAGHLVYPDQGENDLKLLERTYASSGAKPSLLGPVADLENVLRRVPVDEVYIGGNARTHGDAMQSAIQACERFGVPFAIPAYAFRLERAQISAEHAISDGYLHYLNTAGNYRQHGMKRLFDIVSSAVALWLLLPLLALVAAAIRLTSRGPVFFRQTRVGLHGRQFNMLKFRSMVTNAESLKEQLAAQNEQSGPVFKMRKDPRVTAIGRFIRKYSIDELPQLINVLRGDMSVVGPRPPVPSEVESYEAWQRRRLSVRPGLTCIWQVSGRNQISFEDWMVLDMQYIDNWSLARDFGLIFRTVPVVITGRGAS